MSARTPTETPSPWLSGPTRALADELAQGLLVARDGCVVFANRFLQALASRSDGLLGLKLDDLFEDSGRGLPRAGTRQVDCWLSRPGSERREVLCRRLDAAQQNDAAGDAVTVTWLIEDVTHVRRLERELHRAGRELSEANRECERLRERLRAERAEREELLSVVSHELRTPVTVIGGYNRLLLAEEVGPLTDAQRDFLCESRKSCERLNHFIGNLIDASRAEKGAHVLELSHGPVSPVLDAVAAMFRPLLAEREMSLTVSVTGEGKARFDRQRLEQILTNLIENAIKFGRAGGRIELLAGPMESRAGGDRAMLEIRVRDDGPGIAAADRERIFEPYIQVGDEGKAGGLGLGLAICRRLVDAHGGAIRADERDGGGACFRFTLPVAEA